MIESQTSSKEAWENLETFLAEENVDHAPLTASPQLLAVQTENQINLDKLFPKAYLEFISEFGYVGIAFKYYCSIGFTFLPRSWIQSLSPRIDSNEPVALFAATDLSHVNGYAFVRSDDSIQVWYVEGGVLVESVGSFEEWFLQMSVTIQNYVNELTNLEKEELLEEVIGDPYRLEDYSIGIGEIVWFSKLTDNGQCWGVKDLEGKGGAASIVS